MQKTKASLWVIAATTVTVATLFLLPFTPKIAVRTTQVKLGALEKTVFLEGVVRYQDEQACLNTQAGQVYSVHVSQGQKVQAGDLLISMDTTIEEESLATLSQMLHEQERLIVDGQYAGVISTAVMQTTWDARVTAQELRASIETKRIRAAKDGIMGGVYVQEGDYVAAFTALGYVRGEEKCIAAVKMVDYSSDISDGTIARVLTGTGEALGLATLCKTDAPVVNETTAQLAQQLTFYPETETNLADAEIGDQVTLEVLYGANADVALIPVSAIDHNDMLWVVENDKAMPIAVDTAKHNEQYVCVSDQLIGQRIILEPSLYDLYAGCGIKEEK